MSVGSGCLWPPPPLTLQSCLPAHSPTISVFHAGLLHPAVARLSLVDRGWASSSDMAAECLGLSGVLD